MIYKHRDSGIFWLDIIVRGRRYRRSLRTRERALAIERAHDVAAGLREPRPVGTALAEFIPRYLAWARETKPASFRLEKYHADIIQAWFEKAGHHTLESITPLAVEEFRKSVRERDRRTTKNARPASTTTANRYTAMLRTMFNRAADWALFSGQNPVSKVKFYREGEKVKPLSEAEIAAVMAAAGEISSSKWTSPMGKALHDVCELVLNTGLRRSEALSLRWSDIIDDSLRIRGKGGKVRMVPLNDRARAVLGRQPKATAYVFDVPYRTKEGVLRQVTATIQRKTKIPFHLHLLRHAFASRLLAAGVDIVTVSDILGHGMAMTTLLYTHSSEARKRAAVAQLTDTGQKTLRPNKAISRRKK